jgi:pyruvate,water dikinase
LVAPRLQPIGAPGDFLSGVEFDKNQARQVGRKGAPRGGIVDAVDAGSPADRAGIQPGDVIVAPSSKPSWVPLFAIAAGLVTNTGGILCHAAVVAREFGLPAVVGVSSATSTIRDGAMLEIDGREGTVRSL